MSLRQPPPPPPTWSPPGRDTNTIELSINLITPMFGGGYEAGEIDTACPIHAAGIRGHLRFWWRALYGGRLMDAHELYRAEERVWGSTERESSIRITIEMLKEGVPWDTQAKTPRPDPKKGTQEGYFLFPFQQQVNELAHNGREGVSFRLKVHLRPHCVEVEEIRSTIKAWLAFGGVGARTRRGCGALTVVEANRTEWLPPQNTDQRANWFRVMLSQNAVCGEGFSSLVGADIVLNASKQNAMVVWRDLATFWARFRKGQIDEYSPMSGSKWSDYDTLCDWRSGEDIALSKPYLGLPIIYQKFERDKFDGEIKASDSGRMASPIILKPLALAEGGYCPMILRLQVPLPQSVQIKESKMKPSLRIPTSDTVLVNLGTDNPLEAVTLFAEKLWGVTRIRMEER